MDVTRPGGTETSEGFVPHKRVEFMGKSIDAPVALTLRPDARGHLRVETPHGGYLPVPRSIGYRRYLYVLPGGEVTA